MVARTRRPMRLIPSLVFVAALAASAPAARAGALSAHASCPDGQNLVVTWDWYEDPTSPVDEPAWVGYDVLRRASALCDAYVRVNADIFPRVVGQSHSGSYSEPAPSLSTLYEYEVVPVDANHQPVIMSSTECNPPCVPHTWASAPQESAPTTVGTLTDVGWTEYVSTASGGCWYPFYVANAPMVDALRPYAGTGQVLALYGDYGCGGTDGCGLTVDRYELVSSGPTPTLRPSWGRLKIHYR